ncbi:MAG: LCP family protein [Anaerolineae bacterium]|nr:LCP family protein [Anaerolineae bacterium]
MKLSRRAILIVVLVLVLVIGAVWLLLRLPLGPRLKVTPPATTPPATTPVSMLPTATPAATPAATATQTAPPAAATSTATAIAPTPTPTPARVGGVCGQQGSMIVLLLGESSPEDRPPRGADAIRLVKVDYDAQTVRVLALPPDLWVSTPQLAPARIEATTLTLAYYQAKQLKAGSERRKMAYAAALFAQTLADNLRLAPDQYISVKQEAFRDMVDALGGLSIDLPRDVNGAPLFGYFYAGPQVLNGQAVLDYVRIIQAPGDASPSEWDRIDRQKQVLQALYAQLTRPATLAKLPALVHEFYLDVVTDLNVNQFLSLACLLQEPDVSIVYLELGADLVTVGPDRVLVPKTEQVIQFIDTRFIQ